MMFSLAIGVASMARHFLCTKGMPLIAGRSYNVSMVGSGCEVARLLSLILRQNPLIDQLNLHDMTVSLTAFEGDLDGLDTTGEVKSFVGPERLYESLTDAHIVIFAASMPRKPENAEEIAAITGAVSAVCPDALLVFATRPIDFVVPMAAEFLKKADNYDPRRLFGVTTLHSMRVRNIIAKILHVNPARVNVPVIGGFSVDTAMPVYSQCFPELREEMTDVDSLVEKINKSNYDGLLPKKIAVLTTPYAASRFIDSLLRGLNGEPDVVECSFVGYEAPLLPFFSNRVVLGPEGIQTNLGLPPLTDSEKEWLDSILPVLNENINDGIYLAKKMIDADAKEEKKEEEKKEEGKKEEEMKEEQNEKTELN